MKKKEERNMILHRPPDGVFLYTNRDKNTHQTQSAPENLIKRQQEKIPVLDLTKGTNGVTYPETGGQYVWHEGREFPRKGHVYPEALRDCYYPKRILKNVMEFLASKTMIPFFIVFGLMPKKIKGKIIDKAIAGYLDIVDWILRDHYLHPQFNTDICRALSQPIMTFLVLMGASENMAARFSLVFITLLEYDMAYRLRVEDILSETTKEKLLADPVGETIRLIKILGDRDPTRPWIVDKFASFAKVLKYGFWFIRKEFRTALLPVRFELLQLDDIDRFQVRHWSGYNWFGMTIEERAKKWKPKAYPAYVLVDPEPPVEKTKKRKK